ncbi:MAG: hypothetical protein MMC33_009433 [Icmadophila ericetorum]|nr:hypothetical protein [Icmadophila ericetorum]
MNEPSMKLDRDLETDIYRHPECLEEPPQPFHKSYDIYSLGLVLLEITKWRPLKDIFVPSARELHSASSGKDPSTMTKDELRNLDKLLIENCRAKDIRHMRKTILNRSPKDSHAVGLAFRAEDTFTEVVFSCVRDDFDHFRSSGDDGGLQDMFLRKVLKPLNLCQ